MSGGTGDSTKTIGPILQEARTAKGLTIEAAAAASKVPLSYVRLMEQEQFHLVPDPLYLIRFLIDYATFLGLDPKQVGAQFKEQAESARVSASSHSASSIEPHIDRRRLLIYLLPAVAVVPLIFIGLSLFSGPSSTMPPTQTTPLPSAEMATPPTEGRTAPPPSPHATPPHAEDLQNPSFQYRLQAVATEMTWLAVSADGAPRKEVLLHSGETAQWSANKSFTVTIGNPRGVALSLNGRPIALKGEPGQVIRDLTLPGDSGPPPAGL